VAPGIYAKRFMKIAQIRLEALFVAVKLASENLVGFVKCHKALGEEVHISLDNVNWALSSHIGNRVRTHKKLLW
jgi:hypothetical protein